MNKKMRIYLLKSPSIEHTAVTFAKSSRSPEPFDVILKSLSNDSVEKFGEKWIVGYGHASVAEHAVLSVAIENISRLAGEHIESSRLASYTEKSTRFQHIDKDGFFVPDYVSEDFLSGYIKICNSLMDFYQKAYNVFIEHLSINSEDEKKVQKKALDNARYVLPLATLTNIGMTINAREMEYLISKLLSTNIKEMENIGQNLKTVSLESAPTLLKYANKDTYLESFSKLDSLESIKEPVFYSTDSLPEPKILFYDKEKVGYINNFLLFPHNHDDFYGHNEDVIKYVLDNMLEHSEYPREMEHLYFTFEALIDEGVFYELKRHRMCTISSQKPTISNGFHIPILFEKAGLKKEFEDILKEVKTFYYSYLHSYPNEVKYVIPNASLRRVIITSNLREWYHIIKLRSKVNAHFSIRIFANQIKNEISQLNPSLKFLFEKL
ncbi:MAG: FAD-dependent thymidylate synthase [Thermoplasmata archaeon]